MMSVQNSVAPVSPRLGSVEELTSTVRQLYTRPAKEGTPEGVVAVVGTQVAAEAGFDKLNAFRRAVQYILEIDA